MEIARLFYLLILLAIPARVFACWETAAQRHGVSADLLVALADVESTLNPHAVNSSHFSRTGTKDIGLMGINTNPRVLANLNKTEQQLFDPCTNIDVGARILREKIARHGTTWEAVGAYNASCTTLSPARCAQVRHQYAWRVYRRLMARRANPSLRTSSEPLLMVRLQ